MTNDEFISCIASWERFAVEQGIALPCGRPIPAKFFHIMLGLSNSGFRKLVNGKGSMRKPRCHTAKMVRYLNLLDKSVFADEIRKAIPEYLKEYS